MYPAGWHILSISVILGVYIAGATFVKKDNKVSSVHH